MILNINNVRPGMITATPILNKNNVIILNAGKELNDSIIAALLKNDIGEIDISLTKEQEELYKIDKDIDTTISEELKIKSINSLKDMNINGILESSQEIISAILKAKEFSYSLLEYKGKNTIFGHSVRVAAFAAVLAKYYNKSLFKNTSTEKQAINIEHLTTAALVHDLGKTLQNQTNFKTKEAPNSFKEKLPGIANVPLDKYDENYSSFYTFYLLCQHPEIPADVKLTTLLVGENEIGTGPLKAKTEFINSKQSFIVASKIIRLCSIYDDSLKEVIKSNVSLENISSLLEAHSINGSINKELVDLFIQHIPLYSVGVKVKLSDGRYAIVNQTFTERVNNYKPIVKVVPTGEIIDLRLETALTVCEICGNEISFAELVAKQIIDMNNETTILNETNRQK